MTTAVAMCAAFVLTVIAILALRPIAVAVDLIDRPGGRKTHRGKVPIVGGLAMFVGIVFGTGLLGVSSPWAASLLAAYAMLVATGLLDDRFNLSPWLRLSVQSAAAALLTLGTGTEVSSIGNAFGFGDIELHGIASHIFTILLVVTAINAFNMLDGMDGLAGTVAVIALTAFGLSAYQSGAFELASVCAVVGAAVAAFLLFNLPSRRNRRLRCFMGDAGSTLLGAALAWICIRSSQRSIGGILSPITALWIVGVPVFEFFWTFIRRVGRGQSPLRADAEHFHHLLLRGGFGVRGTFMMFFSLVLLLASVGLALETMRVSDYVSLALLFLMAIIVINSMYYASGLLRFFPPSARRARIWPRARTAISDAVDESQEP